MKSASMLACFNSSGLPSRGGEKSQIKVVCPVTSKQRSVILVTTTPAGQFSCPVAPGIAGTGLWLFAQTSRYSNECPGYTLQYLWATLASHPAARSGGTGSPLHPPGPRIEGLPAAQYLWSPGPYALSSGRKRRAGRSRHSIPGPDHICAGTPAPPAADAGRGSPPAGRHHWVPGGKRRPPVGPGTSDSATPEG